MGQGASTAGHHSDLRRDGSAKQRQAKHRRSTRSLPDAALIRTTPANYQNCSRSNATTDSMNVPNSVTSSSVASQQQMSRRIGVSANGGVGNGVTTIGATSALSYVPALGEQNGRNQETMMKYMHRDAAPYYVSTKTKSAFGPRSLDVSFGRQWTENVPRYQKSSTKARYEAAAGSSNWSDVASDMFRISKHHQNSAAADRSVSDVQSDFVSPAGNDRHVHRQNRGSSRRCQQQKKSRRSEKNNEREQGIIGGERRQQRHESGEPDGEPVSGRLHYRDCSGLVMTTVPENPYKEQEYQKQEDDEKMERRRENGGIIVTKRSKSVHDCASTKTGQLQPPSHPPPRPPKGKLHYYARLENDASGRTTSARANCSLVEHWIDFPSPQHAQCASGAEASPNRSASTDTPTPRSPGSSECDKLVIQSLRAELSAERSLRVDAERRCKNSDKEADANRQRIRQLESDAQKLTDAMNEVKRQHEEEAASWRNKHDELFEKCRHLSDELQRSIEEKCQAELRSTQEKSSYEEYMDSVANQVGHALARQETMKTECTRLQKRVLEVEWENKVLKAQLRLTPVWVNSSNGLATANGNGYSSIPSTAPGTSASSIVSGKTDFSRFIPSNVVDHQNNNGNHVGGVMYRQKSFREKMAGLHRYRQSVGSDPTLDQSGGAGNSVDAIPILSIESLASFNEENEQFPPYDDPVTIPGAQGPMPGSSGRRPYQAVSSFLMVNAGEGLCSRPSSFNFDAAAALSVRSGQCQTNATALQPSHNRFANGNLGQSSSVGGNHCFNKTYGASNQDEMEEDDEPVKNYAAMFGEEGFLSSLPSVAPILTPQAPGASTIMSTPMFNSADPSTIGRNVGRESSDQTNGSRDSSTETLNAASNLQPNGNFFAGSPKRKLDVVVNMLTSVETKQPFGASLYSSKRGLDDKKCKTLQGFGHPAVGIFRDDGYSTMSSELYVVFDSSLLTRFKSSRSSFAFPAAPDSSENVDRSKFIEKFLPKIRRSLSDGQLNERNLIERRLSKRNEPSLNLDALERDYATLLSASADGDEEIGDELVDRHGQSSAANREALCDYDIDVCVPSFNISSDYLLALSQTKTLNERNKVDSSSVDHFPPDPQSAPTTVALIEAASAAPHGKPLSAALERDRPAVKPRLLSRRKASRSNRSSTNSEDSTTTEDSEDANGTVIEASRPSRRISKLANASTSSTSTSFTSDDEDDSRFHVNEGAKTTMQLWLKQLKIKRAGQKSGLVRYMPPGCRPSILRPGVFARFGAEERRALALFDFLHQHSEQRQPPTIKRKAKSRSITDLYENLPYHNQTGTVSGTGGAYFSRSRCSSRASFNGCGSLSTLNSVAGGSRGVVSGRSYSSSLFLSDFCNDDDNCSSSTSNSSLSFTLQ